MIRDEDYKPRLQDFGSCIANLNWKLLYKDDTRTSNDEKF